MIKYLEFNVNDATIKLCFTRMTEEDPWVCLLPNDSMEIIEEIIEEDF